MACCLPGTAAGKGGEWRRSEDRAGGAEEGRKEVQGEGEGEGEGEAECKISVRVV